MRVRPARAADLGVLLELYREPEEAYEAVRPLEGEEAERRFAEVLADGRQETLVAESEGEVVGTLVVAILPNLAHGGAPYAIVENVVVRASQRGRGAGKSLMRETIRRARAAGAYKLVLSANATRGRAHEFYRSLGLRETYLGFEVNPEAPRTSGATAPYPPRLAAFRGACVRASRCRPCRGCGPG